MQVLSSKGKDLEKIAQEGIREDYIINICERNILETQVIFPIW